MRHAAKGCLAAVLVVLVGMSWDLTISRAQQPDNDVPGAEVLTRGPVHEAFAGMVTFNPEPGVVVTKAPPALIEELPPEERPEGDNVTWIPGYWAWDDERSDFLWVSGTWRALPPGREWMAGYWGQTSRGYQWTSGYWADAAARETTYLPVPPATVEVGPNIAAPSLDYGWTPGCWIWYQSRYAWRPGYWVQGRADWDWCPAHYVWSPRGYIFVGGFWDYPVERRGILFAPVYFESGVYLQGGYSYSPSIVISLGVFNDHLFLRPSYSHYYFGDYYAPSYYQGGFYASFSFQSSHYGYDPIYSHQRWEHRRDRDWEHRVEASYQDRRDHETTRPPRTWAAQRNISSTATESTQRREVVAAPIQQLATRKDGPMKFQPVAKEERQKLALRGQEVQKSREQRRTLEAKAVDTTARKPGGAFEPAQVQLPRSPIVAKPVNQLEKNQTPPKAPQAPKPDPKFQPEPARRQPEAERGNPQPQPRRVDREPKPTPGRNEAAPRENQVQPKPERRPGESQGQTPPALQRTAPEPAKLAQPQPERRAPDAAVKAAGDSQRNARASEMKARQESEQRLRESVVREREVTQSNPSRLERQPQRVVEPPARPRPDAGEKGAAELMKNDRQKQGRGNSSRPENPPGP